MTSQLLLCKRLFLEGCKFLHGSDPIACGIAISLFQDSAEMLVWAMVKKFDVVVKDQSGFMANLVALREKGVALNETARIQDLNKARIGFKHNGNLPAPEDAAKYQNTTEVFLRMAMSAHFQTDFEDLSLVDVVPFSTVRDHLKKAELLLKQKAYRDTVGETSIARGIMFAMLERYLPEVEYGLAGADSYIENALKIPGEVNGSYVSGNLNAFRYMSDYLQRVREVMLVSLLRLPFDDYYFLSSTLFRSDRMGDGSWHHVSLNDIEYNDEICARQIACLVRMSLQLNEHLRAE